MYPTGLALHHRAADLQGIALPLLDGGEEDEKLFSAQCTSVFTACPKEGKRFCTQCSSVIPAYRPAIDIMHPENTNSSKTGRAHDQAAPRMIVMADSLRKGVGAGRVSRDKPPAKDQEHGRTTPRKLGTNSSHTGRVYDRVGSSDFGNRQRSICTDLGHTSKDSRSWNKKGRTASAIRGGSEPRNGGGSRVSGIRKIPARPSRLRTCSVPES